MFLFILSTPQHYTYPARSYPYVQKSLPPNFSNQTTDILDDVFYPFRTTDQRMNISRDNNDEDIYV